MTPSLTFDRVWKRFRRGKARRSLRDLVPAWRAVAGRAPRARRVTRDFWALRDLSFEVKPGEVLGIIGGNGAGKSTTLKILNRIMEPTNGIVRTTGKIGALIEVSAGFHQDLTGRQNVFLQGAIMGMRKAEVQRKFDEIVEFSGVADFIDTPVKRYSSGMNARLGFSIAAHLEPDILIIDEVLAVGDASFQQKAFGRIKTMATARARRWCWSRINSIESRSCARRRSCWSTARCGSRVRRCIASTSTFTDLRPTIASYRRCIPECGSRGCTRRAARPFFRARSSP